MSGYIRYGQVKPGWDRLREVNSGCVSLGQVSADYI
jgi:hypothetical protein